MGDPRHLAGQCYDVGTSTRDGVISPFFVPYSFQLIWAMGSSHTKMVVSIDHTPILTIPKLRYLRLQDPELL